jgi:hypothetical protein
MVYVCCYGNEFKFFKLRKEGKRGKKGGNLLGLPAPESKVFFAVRRPQ